MNEEIKKAVELSLATPQRGVYHNEGPTMEVHLDLMRKVFHGGDYLELMDERVVGDFQPNVVEKYILLHDVMKPHCMTFVYSDGKKVVTTWEEWLEIKGDKEVNQALDDTGVESISYFQRGKPFRAHGPVAEKWLKEQGYENDLVLKAIRRHEMAFTFLQDGETKINLKSFRKNFGDLSEEELKFALLVSLLDQLASLRPDGKPQTQAYFALEANYLAFLEEA